MGVISLPAVFRWIRGALDVEVDVDLDVDWWVMGGGCGAGGVTGWQALVIDAPPSCRHLAIIVYCAPSQRHLP